MTPDKNGFSGDPAPKERIGDLNSWEWVVLDIDGVLIGVSESYDRAVELTAEKLLAELGADYQFSPTTIRSFRKKGQFGDDYKVTEGLVLAGTKENPEEFVAGFPAGKGLEWIRERTEMNIGRDRVKEIFDRYYLGGKYGDEITTTGLWEREEAMVDGPLLEKIETRFNLGFITGRSRQEVRLAGEILDYDFSRVITREDYHKPDPRALRTLVGGESGVYLGDTLNDRLLVENFNDTGGEFDFIPVEDPSRTEGLLAKFISDPDR